MKKNLCYLFVGTLVLIMSGIYLISELNKEIKSEEKLDKIKLGEVTHSAFYAPLYVAIENGYFKDEGIEIDLRVISGANNVTSAVLSKDIDIGFCGPEATIYVYNGGEKDYIINFAGLTKRDGQFLVSRRDEDNFKWDNLKGKSVLAGRIAGMPELNFENALRNEGIDVNDVKIDTSIDFASLTSAFISGTGDYVNLFEPNATKLEHMGYGYIVDSIGSKSGELTYTAFNTRRSYYKDNKDLLIRFSNAIDRGLKYVHDNEASHIADSILNQFPDISRNDLISIVTRYKDSDSWLYSPFISETLFYNLEDIMLNSKQIDSRVSYTTLVYNLYKK